MSSVSSGCGSGSSGPALANPYPWVKAPLVTSLVDPLPADMMLSSRVVGRKQQPRQRRGGWKREQPPKFMTEDERKQWEKDRRKKDNHNQSMLTFTEIKLIN